MNFWQNFLWRFLRIFCKDFCKVLAKILTEIPCWNCCYFMPANAISRYREFYKEFGRDLNEDLEKTLKSFCLKLFTKFLPEKFWQTFFSKSSPLFLTFFLPSFFASKKLFADKNFVRFTKILKRKFSTRNLFKAKSFFKAKSEFLAKWKSKSLNLSETFHLRLRLAKQSKFIRRPRNGSRALHKQATNLRKSIDLLISVDGRRRFEMF